jgi:hypothetical protein
MENSSISDNVLLRSKVSEIIENSINLFEKKSKLIYKEIDNLRKEYLDQLHKLNEFIYKNKTPTVNPRTPILGVNSSLGNGQSKSKLTGILSPLRQKQTHKTVKVPQIPQLQYQNSQLFKQLTGACDLPNYSTNSNVNASNILSNPTNHSSMIIKDLSKELKKISSSSNKFSVKKQGIGINTGLINSGSGGSNFDKKSVESTPKSGNSNNSNNKSKFTQNKQRVDGKQTSSNNIANLSQISNASNISSSSNVNFPIQQQLLKTSFKENEHKARKSEENNIMNNISTNDNKNNTNQKQNKHLTEVRKFSILDIPSSVEVQAQSNTSLINPLNLTNNSLSILYVIFSRRI